MVKKQQPKVEEIKVDPLRLELEETKETLSKVY